MYKGPEGHEHIVSGKQCKEKANKADFVLCRFEQRWCACVCMHACVCCVCVWGGGG